MSTLTLAESAAVVGELRRARRKRRVASIHWVDALYQVYITGLVAVVGVILLSSAIGDGEVVADEVELGDAGIGEEDLAGVGDGDLVPVEGQGLGFGACHRSRG